MKPHQRVTNYTYILLAGILKKLLKLTPRKGGGGSPKPLGSPSEANHRISRVTNTTHEIYTSSDL